MSDEEKKDVTDETPKDEAAEAAGPVAEGDPSSSQAAGDVPPSTPPAEETPEAEAKDEPDEDSELEESWTPKFHRK